MTEPTYDRDTGSLVLHQSECRLASVRNSKDQLAFDVFSLWKGEGLGWLSAAQAQSVGVPFAMALHEVLWEITDQWDTLAAKNCRPEKVWEAFQGKRLLTHKAKRAVDMPAVEKKLAILEDLLLARWWDEAPTWSAGWKVMHTAVRTLCTQLNTFLSRRAKERVAIVAHRQAPRAVVVRGTNYDVFPTIRPKLPSETVPAHFADLAEKLAQLPLYVPVCLNEVLFNARASKQRAPLRRPSRRVRWTRPGPGSGIPDDRAPWARGPGLSAYRVI